MRYHGASHGLLLLLVLAPTPSAAAPGDLDSGFGSAGIATAQVAGATVTDNAEAVARYTDGHFMAVGWVNDSPGFTRDFALARFKTDGMLDDTFDSDGMLRTDPNAGGGYDTARAVLIQPDQKILVAGDANTISNERVVARYEATGPLDGTFATGGIYQVPDGIVGGMALQSDGKIVISEFVNSTDTVAVTRLTSGGVPDVGFGTNGIVSLPDVIRESFPVVALQPDGKIIVVATKCASLPVSSCSFLLTRLEDDGDVDTTFGTNGSTLAGGSVARAVALQPDGSIIVVGYGVGGGVVGLAVARYSASGTFLNASGTGAGSDTTYGYGVAIQPDGKVIATGSALIFVPSLGGNYRHVIVARFRANVLGLDATFASSGVATVDATVAYGEGRTAVVEPDGKIVVAGEVAMPPATTDHVALLRFAGGPICGNTTVDAGEQCDDGNLDDGDCCAYTCQFEPNGQPSGGGTVCDGAGNRVPAPSLPLSKCTAEKFKAASKKTNSKSTCHAKAVAKGFASVDSTCIAKAEVKFSSSFAKADAKQPNCLGLGDAATVEGSVDTFIDDLAAQLGGPGPNLCTSTKYKAAGKKAKGKLDCVAKALAKGLGVDSTCIAKTEVKFSTAFAKADTKIPACITTGDGTTVEGMVDSFFDDVKNELLP